MVLQPEGVCLNDLVFVPVCDISGIYHILFTLLYFIETNIGGKKKEREK